MAKFPNSRFRLGIAAAALLAIFAVLVPAGTAGAKSRAPDLTVPRQGRLVFKRQLQVSSATYSRATKTLRAVIGGNADDLHDLLLVYATAKPCARGYQAAINQTRREGSTGELMDVELGFNPGYGVSVRRKGQYAYRYSLFEPKTSSRFKNLCAMLYDSPGDPRGPGNPQTIPNNHVWETAQASISR